MGPATRPKFDFCFCVVESQEEGVVNHGTEPQEVGN